LGGPAENDQTTMSMAPDLPAHQTLVAELRTLREKGLIRLRRLSLPALEQTAQVAMRADSALDSVEALLRRAVGALGEEETGVAAAYLFGLVPGTIGRRPTDLRERAALEYNQLSPETFRKGPEQLLIERIADEILILAKQSSGDVEPRLARPQVGAGPDILRDLARALADAGPVGEQYSTARYGPYPMTCGDNEVRVWVDVGKVEHLVDVDVVVSAENAFLEPARMYTATLSGSLRRAAALRDSSGEITRDVVAEELGSFVRNHGSIGKPFELGLVVPTSSGNLVEQGIRRLYHAAAAMPDVGGHEYLVTGEGIVRSIRSLTALLRRERDAFTPPLRSFSVPLFGAGYGRLDPAVSFDWIWRALRNELARDGSWEVHLTALSANEAVAVLRGLSRDLGEQ
jgi:hypothetical protein